MIYLFVLLIASGWSQQRAAVGLAADGKVIEATLATGAGSRVLLIGGLDGPPVSNGVIKQAGRRGIALTTIALANPAKSKLVFPPTGDAYRDNSESHAIWRWIATTGPDLILIAGADPAGLAAAVKNMPVRLVTDKWTVPGKSETHAELDRRAARTAGEVAAQLEKVYGHDLNDVVYIPAFAVLARLRMGFREDVERIAAPYVTGAKNSMDRASSSHFSGHLLFAELAERTKDPRYTKLVLAAANFAFTEKGEMKESMPMHSQMSDSVFMSCPILVKAGKLTGERKYYDMAARHFRFMKKLDARPDGLWRHSPQDEAAWGRGNAFALLGMALALADLPKNHEGYSEMLTDYRSLANALAKQQDEFGMWRQVVDLRGSYRELSATSMIARSMLLGVRHGWLDARAFHPRIQSAWEAVKLRSGSDGTLVDVCEGTGAQKTLADYLRRKAILGVDPRGGAMALMLAVEMAGQR